ncbi:MAG TPA: hypothetical protein VMW54_11805 [Terriglobia bacterium]|nr:hypothetical protein [Terriglobia bacterium]
MSQHGKVRSRERAITALLTSPTIESAAREAGISKRTLLRWLQQPDFREQYTRAKADVLRSATGILTRNAGRAAQVLREVFEDEPTAHQGGRVTAAIATLRLSLDAFELENLEERLRKLEGQDEL